MSGMRVLTKNSAESVKSLDDGQDLLDFGSLTKSQKRWEIEKLIKASKNYDEIWEIEAFAKKMNYSLTKRQAERIIEKLVWTADSSEKLIKVKSYASSKNLYMTYFNARYGKEIAEVLMS